MSVTIDVHKIKSTVAEFDFNKYREKLNNINILQKGKFNKGESNGLFEDNLWVCHKELEDTYIYIDFSFAEKLRFYGFNKTHLDLLKCWVADDLCKKAPASVRTDLNYVSLLLFESYFFDEELIDDCNGFFMKDLFDNIECKNNTKSTIKKVFIHYLDFIIKSGFVNVDIVQKYLKDAQDLKFSSISENNVRSFPSTRNILLLGSYIDIFFSENKNDLATYYMPILLWWKITNVIPMRPSEFARKIPRDCLIQKDGSWYLKVNRTKLRDYKTKDKRRLPVLTEFQISDDIANMIQEYIELTKDYGESETLISYSAYVELRRVLYNNNHITKYYSQSLGAKQFPKNFSIIVFAYILRNFYKYVILGMYNVDLTNDMVKLGDTRHFAILSLVIQGYSRIEVALMSGHTTLQSQEHYYSNIEYYLDSEVYKLIYNRIKGIDKKESFKNLKNIKDRVSSMPEQPPKPLEQLAPLDVGYCSCNFTEGESCESKRCYKCSKWWCEPTEANYKAKVDLVIRDHYSPAKAKLQSDVYEFIELLETSGLFSFKDLEGSDFVSENPYNYELLKTKSKSIKFLAEDIINTQIDLIDTERLEKHVNSIVSDVLYVHELEDKE